MWGAACVRTDTLLLSHAPLRFTLRSGECPLDGHASLMIDILTIYIFSISTYTMLKINVHEGLFWAHFWNIATNKRSWRFIFSNFINVLLKINVCEGLFLALFWNFATNERSWRFIFSNFINVLLKINVCEGLFLAIFWNFATNKPSWRFIFSNFINILLKINVRLCSIRCHVCTMMVQMWHCIQMLVWIYLQHFLTVFAKNKCAFIYFSNIFLNLVLKINVRLRFI